MPSSASSAVHAHMHAAAELLRTSSPLPPMAVYYNPESSAPVLISPEVTVSPQRQDVAVRRLARALGTEIHPLSAGAVHTEKQWKGTRVLVVRAAPDRAQACFNGHGFTIEHADLLQELVPWITQILDAGASSLRVSENTIPGAHPEHALTVIAFAHAEHMTSLAETYALAYTNQQKDKKLGGTGLTPTGHHLVLVQET